MPNGNKKSVIFNRLLESVSKNITIDNLSNNEIERLVTEVIHDTYKNKEFSGYLQDFANDLSTIVKKINEIKKTSNLEDLMPIQHEIHEILNDYDKKFCIDLLILAIYNKYH